MSNKRVRAKNAKRHTGAVNKTSASYAGQRSTLPLNADPQQRARELTARFRTEAPA